MSDKKKDKKVSKLKIDREKCINCGTCVATYSELFEFADDGDVVVKKDADFTGKDLDEIKGVCPQEAIVE